MATTLDFSANKHTLVDGEKILAMNGEQAGYIDTADLANYILATRGLANGLATLDANSKLLSTQIPDSVNNVKAYANTSSFPATGSDNTLYVAKDTNKLYRWNTTSYTELTVDISGKADTSYVNAQLALKANSSTTYTKTEVDTALGSKADSSTTYTKTEVDSAISPKADTSTVNTLRADLTEVDSRLRGLDMRETDSHSVTLMVDSEGSLKNMIIETGSATEALCVYESDIVTDSYVRTVFGL